MNKVSMVSTHLDNGHLLAALRAFRKGNFSVRLPAGLSGIDGEIAEAFNDAVEISERMTKEFERLGDFVGKDGKIGHRAKLPNTAGSWATNIETINTLIADMVQPTAEMARVIGAVAKGDLSQTMNLEIEGRPLRGEFLRIGKVVNTMVGQLGSFASEVTRVAREVGTEGKLGGQAKVKGVAGTWKDLTDNVNAMAANLTGQVRNIAEVTTAVANGDLTKKITVDVKGEILELKTTINTMVDQLNSFASEVTRVAREVGTEGKLGGQANVKGVAGTWKDLTDNVNLMAANLTGQVRNIAEVTTAIAKGDLSKKIAVDVKGEILELKNTINTLVDQLNSFASEVTRVAREVGTEGKLGGQAQVPGVAGTWKDLTDNVNMMAANLTGQVRGIADVVTAVAQGNLRRKLTLEAKGEIASLAETINGMIETLATFADQVTNVAREVGIEGKLGGQARVPGAAGLWRDLTDNVNQLAANLTNQVRAIAEVSTAVTKGDLTRSITVEASGEVAALKDNINEMIRNLKEQTLKNTEQDWLKTNLARFTRMLQGERDLATVSNMVLSELAPLVNAQHGLFYVADKDEDTNVSMNLAASYAFNHRKHLANRFALREGLVGQCAYEKSRILLTNVPSGYIHINSGLGEAAPLNVIVLPVVFEGEVNAVIELASFSEFSETHQSFLDQLMESIGIVLNTIAANMRTEGLLKQSQLLTAELQAQQEELKKTNDRLEQQANTLRQSEELLRAKQDELQRTNVELEDKAQLLSMQNMQVEAKNREVEQAKRELEERAEQLALTSKYKSEFLANMSHELRTPLNSLLILSKLLSSNSQGNLTDKQVEYAHSIHHAGSDLLALINDILDLSKIESGTVTLDVSETMFSSLRDHMDRTFAQIAQDKKLEFAVQIDPQLSRSMFTDDKRLQQIMKNLLSNAFKFTESGSVKLKVSRAESGWSNNAEHLDKAGEVVAFMVEDTGIGIPLEKQRIIFEAFQQADGTTSRKYGGTGLGLSISREITRLLGGELTVNSTPGRGSVFTLFLPANYTPSAKVPSRMPIANVRAVQAAAEATHDPVVDDRDTINRGDPTVLIVEDDPNFSAILLSLAHESGFKGVVTGEGAAVLPLAKRFRPDAITLDIGLPDMDGFALLDLLKRNPDTRHIPVHIISGDEQRRLGMGIGAYGYSNKPVEPESIRATLTDVKTFREREKRLLVIEPETSEGGVKALIGSGDVHVESLSELPESIDDLDNGPFDCVVIDLTDASESALVEQLEQLRGFDVPFIAFIPRDWSEKEQAYFGELKLLDRQHLVRTQAQLQDEVARVLHWQFERLPVPAQDVMRQSRPCDPLLVGRKVAVVDDDIRNIFSLTSALEEHGVELHYAESGRSGIELLQCIPDVDAALIDIMMPGMDGYQTIAEIRAIPKFASLPIIAVTAKAMKGDRQKCIEAGASDYVAKPVDIEQLVSVLRVWLHRTDRPKVLKRTGTDNVVQLPLMG